MRWVVAAVVAIACLATRACATRDTRSDELFIAGIFAQKPVVADAIVGDRYFVRALQAEATLSGGLRAPRR